MKITLEIPDKASVVGIFLNTQDDPVKGDITTTNALFGSFLDGDTFLVTDDFQVFKVRDGKRMGCTE